MLGSGPIPQYCLSTITNQWKASVLSPSLYSSWFPFMNDSETSIVLSLFSLFLLMVLSLLASSDNSPSHVDLFFLESCYFQIQRYNMKRKICMEPWWPLICSHVSSGLFLILSEDPRVHFSQLLARVSFPASQESVLFGLFIFLPSCWLWCLW